MIRPHNWMIREVAVATMVAVRRRYGEFVVGDNSHRALSVSALGVDSVASIGISAKAFPFELRDGNVPCDILPSGLAGRVSSTQNRSRVSDGATPEATSAPMTT